MKQPWHEIPLPIQNRTSRELYDAVWSNEQYRTQPKRYAYFIKVLKTHRQPLPLSYLDVGCGRGDVMEQARGLGYSVRGCDIADQITGDDKPHVDQILTAADLPYDDQSFDIVSMLDVIEHLHPGGEWEDAINECVRVTRRIAVFSICTILDKWGPHLGLGHLHVNVRPFDFWEEWVKDRFGGAAFMEREADNLWVTITCESAC